MYSIKSVPYDFDKIFDMNECDYCIIIISAFIYYSRWGRNIERDEREKSNNISDRLSTELLNEL